MAAGVAQVPAAHRLRPALIREFATEKDLADYRSASAANSRRVWGSLAFGDGSYNSTSPTTFTTHSIFAVFTTHYK